MPSINVCIIMGNLTREPDLRYTPSGSPVCEMALAVNRKSNGREDVTYIDVVAWGKNAENCKRYLEKGRCVMIEGYLKTETWDDRSSRQRRSRLKLVCETLHFISSPRGNTNRASEGSLPPSGPNPPPPPAHPAEYSEGDIPF